MSRERRYISQRKIRRIKRVTDDSALQLDTESTATKPAGLSPNTKMYYTKVCFGIGTGVISGLIHMFLGVAASERILLLFPIWFTILILGLLTCLFFVRFILHIPDDQVDQKRLWLSGTFTFTVLFIVVSALTWMLMSTFFLV